MTGCSMSRRSDVKDAMTKTGRELPLFPSFPGGQVQTLATPFSHAQFLLFAHLTSARLLGVTTARDC